jgi:3-hydroxyisobutyrate dehydrogenase-like beta-hydroxyacid dehydrogenase
VVFTMLADDAALAEVAQGPGGLVESLPRGGVHVVMGTHQIASIRRLAEAHAAAGQVLVAAPVLGRPEAVVAGRLGIIVGGPADAIARVQPLFEAVGRRTFPAGAEPSAASLLKLTNNFVLACAIEAMGEAFCLVEKSGTDPAAFREIMTDGLFACPAYDGYSRTIIDRDYDKVGFTAQRALKDVNLALAAGEAAGVPLPSANVCRDRLLGAIAHGDGQRDWAVMALEQARASGLA